MLGRFSSLAILQSSVFLLLLGVGASGCDLAGILVKAQVDGANEFTEAHGSEFADPEMVGPVLANGIVTGEGYLYNAPEYEPLIQSQIFANVAYGVGFLGAQANAAEVAGKYDEVEHLNKRATLLF